MRFIDRKAKYPGRWTIKKSDGTSEVVTLVRNDEPEIEGTPMNAATLNTLSDVAGADLARLQAEAAAQNALGSQRSALSSANAAENSAIAAKESERNAALSESVAKTSETNSKNSADSAAVSEKNAKTYSESVQALTLGLSIVDGALCMTYDDGTTTAGVPESEE